MARNEATRHARGQWLLHFDDDDRLHPDSISRLLALARSERAEVSYGRFEQHGPDGRSWVRGAFPPQSGGFGWPAAIMHGGLRLFERELVAAHLGLPGDMYLLTRMLRVGVRFAFLDEVVLDYFPSSLWEPAHQAGGASVLASLAQLGPVAYSPPPSGTSSPSQVASHPESSDHPR
jgi:glycosyltransferase involved in cell wall biosynthesis